MAVANVAWILACNGKSVLVLDWDLEAPGLHRYFRPFLIDKELVSSDGIIDFVIDYADEAIKPPPSDQALPENWFAAWADITRNAVSVNFEGFPDGGQISLIPAGRQGTTYATRVNSFDWKNFYVRLAGKVFMEEARRRMCEQYEYVLIDSRTGVSDTAGICTVQMPDVLAVCFTLNNQSIEGASAVTKSVTDQHRKKASDLETVEAPLRQARIVPIPMRVDPFEKDKLDRRRLYAQSKFDPFIQHVPITEREKYWVETEVPYMPYFAYEELLSTFRENPNDPKSVLSAMVRIANYLIPPEGDEGARFEFASLISPQIKDEILKEFADTPGLAWTESQAAVTPESKLKEQIRLAESIYQGLDEQERFEARRLWMRLVRIPRPGEGTEETKARVPLKDLGRESRPIVSKFAASDLLILSESRDGGEKVEVANEELLRNWSRLRKWIEADRWLLLWRQELQTSKAEWEQRNHDATELLQGRTLEESRQWYATHSEFLNEQEKTYVEESIRADDARRWRERRTKVLTTTAFVAFVMLMVIGFYYYSKSTSKTAIAKRIATDAQNRIDASATAYQPESDFQLGILLATEASRVAKSPEAEEILRKNLPRLPRVISISNQSNNVLRVALNENGSQILAVTGRPRGNQPQPEDRAAQLQETQTRQILSRMAFKQGTEIFDLSPNGRYFATADAGGKVSVMDVVSGLQVGGTNHQGSVRDLAFSPDGRYFASGGADQTAQIVDLSTAAKGGPSAVVSLAAPVNAIAFSSDSQHLAVANDASEVHVWPIKPGATSWPTPTSIKLDSAAFTIALSPNGVNVATIPFQNQQVSVWRVSDQRRVLLNHDYNVSSVVFSPDGMFIITAGNAGNITIWDQGGQRVNTRLRFEGDVDGLLFSNDGKRLAAIGNSRVARVWDYHDGRFEESFWMIQDGIVNDLAFGGGNLSVTAGADNTIRVWELGATVTADLQQYEPCSRLTRNLTFEEWNQYLAADLGAYRPTCSLIAMGKTGNE